MVSSHLCDYHLRPRLNVKIVSEMIVVVIVVIVGFFMSFSDFSVPWVNNCIVYSTVFKHTGHHVFL